MCRCVRVRPARPQTAGPASLATRQHTLAAAAAAHASDTRALLASGSEADAQALIAARPHVRLWRLLAEHALQRLDLPVAEAAFAHSADYHGLQLVKHLATLGDRDKQRAEVRGRQSRCALCCCGMCASRRCLCAMQHCACQCALLAQAPMECTNKARLFQLQACAASAAGISR